MYYLQNELTHFGIGILQYFEVKKRTKKLIKTFELHQVFIYQNVPISALCILLELSQRKKKSRQEYESLMKKELTG